MQVSRDKNCYKHGFQNHINVESFCTNLSACKNYVNL
jgi:hypothetical protein